MRSIGVAALVALCLCLLTVPTQSWQLFSRCNNINPKEQSIGDSRRGSVFASSPTSDSSNFHERQTQTEQMKLLKPAATLGLSLLLGVAPIPLLTAPSDLLAAAGMAGSAATNGMVSSFGHTGRALLLAEAKAAVLPVAGTKAPDFSLPSNQGKDLSLADFAGKRTVLYFYPGDFTSGCTIEAQGFQRDLAQYRALGVQVVGVSVDGVDKHLDFSKKYGLDFPLLSDKGGAVSDKYGSLLDLGFIGKFSNRQTYILSPTGEIEYVFTDVESRVAQHSQDVLSKLKSMQ